MTEIQGKSILVRVSVGSSNREWTVILISFRSFVLFRQGNRLMRVKIASLEEK